jgi:hypothetical protein
MQGLRPFNRNSVVSSFAKAEHNPVPAANALRIWKPGGRIARPFRR